MAFIGPFLATYGSTIATVASVASSLLTGISQANQYQSAAAANQYNAAVARQRSSAVLSAANQREEQQRRYARIQAGERMASIAQSGTGLGGSNADIERQSEIFAELDALNIRYEGQTESIGLLNEAGLQDYYAKVNKSNATSSLFKGGIGAATQLLTSGIFDKSADRVVTIGGGGGYW